jgi:hypothetical protein
MPALFQFGERRRWGRLRRPFSFWAATIWQPPHRLLGSVVRPVVVARSAGSGRSAGAVIMAPILPVQCFLARTPLGWSKSELARASGTSPTTMIHFARGGPRYHHP